MSDWMIYGANGYTGRLLAREACRREMQPILAGRSASGVGALAASLGCAPRIFPLDDPRVIARNLEGVSAVLHCAGPFSATAAPLMDACLLAGAHYLDITGEIDVIEAGFARDARARQAGVALIPAVGFDVVPSDCLAAMLKAELPTATHLELAFYASGDLSPGTAKTSLESLPRGGRIRRGGALESVPPAWKTLDVPFADKTRHAATIPWGDVASAYHSTGIPNIEVYMSMSHREVRSLQRLRWLMPVLRLSFLQGLVRRWIERRVKGPSAAQLAKSHAEFWGRATNASGSSVEATLSTPGGYPLTVTTSLVFLEAAREGRLPAGFGTPSAALGADVILRVPDTSMTWRQRAPAASVG